MLTMALLTMAMLSMAGSSLRPCLACTSRSRSLTCRLTSSDPLNACRICRSHAPRKASWCLYASAS
jgi:hypothetical protein